MNAKRFTRFFAAAAVAAALALGGLLGAGSADQPDVPEEVAGGTWSFSADPSGGGGYKTNGGTWS